MDGYEATRQIRKWEVEKCDKCGKGEFQSNHVLAETNIECKHNRLPIVAVTADVMKETHELCYTAGMDDYITKVPNQSLHASNHKCFFMNQLKKFGKKKSLYFECAYSQELALSFANIFS
jgi:CheY-like chemotaxis protein